MKTSLPASDLKALQPAHLSRISPLGSALLSSLKDKSGWFLAIDPGCPSGIACFSLPRRQLMKVFCTDRKKEWDWGTASDRTMDEIEAVFRWSGPLILGVACEWPAYFDDAGGRMAAVKDDLSKIVFMVGRVAQLCYSNGNYNFTPVPVAHWKGQLPKPAVEARIRRNLQRTRPEGIAIIEEVAPTSTCSKGHVWDAVGIGLYTLGDF